MSRHATSFTHLDLFFCIQLRSEARVSSIEKELKRTDSLVPSSVPQADADHFQP
jgi:hypothetical protein